MSFDSLLRIGALCVVLACAETLHGIFRTVVLVPRMGKARAIKLSAFTGTLLALAICGVLVPGIALKSAAAHLALGLGLAVFMACFDIAIGRWLMHKAWARIWPDFQPSTGNYLSYGLLALAGIPLVIWFLRPGAAPGPGSAVPLPGAVAAAARHDPTDGCAVEACPTRRTAA